MSKFAYLYADPTQVTQSVGATPYGLYDADLAFQSESLSSWPLQFLTYPLINATL